MDPVVSSCDHEGDDDLCPLGTPVSLGATVWYEDDQGEKNPHNFLFRVQIFKTFLSDSGLLVVNVKWRGRTYVGTLIDSSKQNSLSQNR